MKKQGIITDREGAIILFKFSVNQKANHVVRTVKVTGFEEFKKILLTIQDEWKGKILSISEDNSEYQIMFQIRKPVNILCRIPETDKYGWCIPQKFKKNWKNINGITHYISAIKKCIIDHWGKVDDSITDDKIMHIVYYMLENENNKARSLDGINTRIAKYNKYDPERLENEAHSALIYAKDKTGKQIISY